MTYPPGRLTDLAKVIGAGQIDPVCRVSYVLSALLTVEVLPVSVPLVYECIVRFNIRHGLAQRGPLSSQESQMSTFCPSA